MTTIILVIIGVLLAAAAALMLLFYGSDVFERYSTEAEAARMVSEGAQIESAVELYYRNNDRYPQADGAGSPVETLISADYLTHAPRGDAGGNAGGQWTIDYDEGQILSRVGNVSDEEAMLICTTARRQVNMPDPENVLQCDGSDSPGGKLSALDPCCIRN